MARRGHQVCLGRSRGGAADAESVGPLLIGSWVQLPPVDPAKEGHIGPHPVTGRRRQKSKSGFATKKEAESALHDFIRYVERGGDPSPERVRLAEYLRRWIDYQRARGIRSRTLEGYEGYIRREIVPVIGGLELAKLRPGHIRAVLARVQQRGLSAATVAQVRSVLGSALRQAVAEGLIAANPVASVKRPRLQRREVHWPTSVQLGALLQTSLGSTWEVPILLATVTGARRAEVLGIAWEDVDLEAGTISIRRGVQAVPHPEGRTVEFTALKTKRSRRVVQLPLFALERIRRHRREQLRRRTALGATWRDPLDRVGRPVSLVCERGDGWDCCIGRRPGARERSSADAYQITRASSEKASARRKAGRTSVPRS